MLCIVRQHSTHNEFGAEGYCDVVQGYGPDAVASATNTLESGSRKGVQEAMQKAGHSFPAASMSAAASVPRVASGAA